MESGQPTRDGAVDLAGLDVNDVGAVQTALLGRSAVDMARLWLTDRRAVDAFLRLHQFDTDNPLDLDRLRALHHDAIVYLADTHRYRLPRQIEEPGEIHDLFLAATGESGRLQRFACMALKVMHIQHHLAARELIFNSSISEAILADRLNARVFQVIDQMRAAGVAVQEFAAGKKSRESLITKLLAKRETLASTIYDKVRFRVVFAEREDIVLALVFLMRHLVPFNYVVPGQSQNGLVSEEDLVRLFSMAATNVDEDTLPPTPREARATPQNEFSGPTYRCVNLVADIPLRIDDVVDAPPPAISFVQAEIQLVDARTEEANNAGENAHPLYKKRQRERVRRRLEALLRRQEDAEDES